MTECIAGRRQPNGFTVIEVMLVSGLMSLLVLLISGAWRGLGRTTADVSARCRVAQEANLAAETLARDFGGSLPEQVTGQQQSGRLVGRLIVDGQQLRLCFDRDNDGQADWGSPDTVVTYELDTQTTYGVPWKRLVRWNLETGSGFTAAANLDQMQLTEQGDGVKIDLTFTCRNITRTYTIVAKDP